MLPQNTYETIQFTLQISNRNDFAPQFPRSLAQISIPESYPVGARFEISDLAASDGDFLDQEELKYKLMPDDLFRVENEGGRLFLVPRTLLDRETTSFVKGKKRFELQKVALEVRRKRAAGLETHRAGVMEGCWSISILDLRN